MKLKIKTTSETEIEVTFPLSYATDVAYYHIVNENFAIAMYPISRAISPTSASIALMNYKPGLEINKWEAEEVFNDIVRSLYKDSNFIEVPNTGSGEIDFTEL
jgi:hypothetical protein